MRYILVNTLLLVAISLKGYSQNAYYDAKYIAHWLDSPKLSQSVMDTLRIKVFSYTGKDTNWAEFRQYPILEKLYEKIESAFFLGTAADSLVDLIVTHNSISAFGNRFPADSRDRADADAIENKIKSREQLIAKIKSLSDFIKRAKTPLAEDLAALKTSFNKRLALKDTMAVYVNKYFNSLVSNELQYIDSLRKANKGDSATLVQWKMLLSGTSQLVVDSIKKTYNGAVPPDDFNVNDHLFLYAKDTLVSDSSNNAQKIVTAEVIACQELASSIIQICLLNQHLSDFLFDSLSDFLNGGVPKYNKSSWTNRIKPTDGSKTNLIISPSSSSINSANVENAAIQAAQPTAGLSNPQAISTSELIDQVAILMVKRFKQEVSLTFLDWIRKKLNGSEILRDLFPATLHQLNNTEVFELPRFGKVWANVLSDDFTKLPENLAKSQFILSRIKNSRFQSLQQEVYIFSDLVTIATAANQQIALPDIVSFYDNGQIMLKSDYSKAIFNILSLVNNELSDSSTKYWLSWQSILNMHPKEWEVLCALIQEKYQSTVFKKLILDTHEQPQLQIRLKKYFVKVVNVLNSFETNMTSYNKQLQTNPSAKYTGINFWDLQNTLFNMLLDSTIVNLNGRARHIVWLTQQGLMIYKLREQKDMAGMLHASFDLLDSLLPSYNNRLTNILIKQWQLDDWQSENGLDTLEKRLNNLADFFDYARSKKKELQGTALVKDVFAKYKEMINPVSEDGQPDSMRALFRTAAKDFLNQTLKYQDLLIVKKDSILGNVLFDNYYNSSTGLSTIISQPSRFLGISKAAEFLTDLLTAKNSNQISEIISTYSMPANSYKIKRNSQFSWDINGYVGAYGATEFIREPSYRTGRLTSLSGAFVYGFSAPIGVTFSYGYAQESKLATPTTFLKSDGKLRNLTGNCLSVTLSLFDLGAVVSYRVENGENGALPQQVNWGQLFSPGIHVREGIRNTPLCVSEGIQLTPQLRNLSGAGGVDQKQAWRIYAGIFFDIPFFNISHR